MFLKILYIIWLLFQLYIWFQLLFPIFSYLLYQITKKSIPSQNIPVKVEEDYAIIVTAYMDTSYLPHVIDSLLKLNYSNYLIYIVADNCTEIVALPDDPKLIVLRPEEVLASQARSHFYAIRHFKRKHKRLTIIDSDNIAEPDYLIELNKYFDAGFNAVQGKRTAKNFDSIFASIDATNELYYRFYDRKLLFNIGSSSMLSGSGMAFDVNLYKECMEHDIPSGEIDKELQKKILARRKDILECGWGFDRILQKEIVSKNYRIAFSEGAIVYDQKTSKSDQLIKQRARWNNSWFRFSKFGFGLLGNGLKNINFNQFIFGFILLRPPLFILLIVAFLITLISVFISHTFFLIWVFSLVIFVISFFISLLSSNADQRIYKSLIYIPVFIFYQLLSLRKTRKARKYSVATEHSYTNNIGEIK